MCLSCLVTFFSQKKNPPYFLSLISKRHCYLVACLKSPPSLQNLLLIPRWAHSVILPSILQLDTHWGWKVSLILNIFIIFLCHWNTVNCLISIWRVVMKFVFFIRMSSFTIVTITTASAQKKTKLYISCLWLLLIQSFCISWSFLFYVVCKCTFKLISNHTCFLFIWQGSLAVNSELSKSNDSLTDNTKVMFSAL